MSARMREVAHGDDRYSALPKLPGGQALSGNREARRGRGVLLRGLWSHGRGQARREVDGDHFAGVPGLPGRAAISAVAAVGSDRSTVLCGLRSHDRTQH